MVKLKLVSVPDGFHADFLVQEVEVVNNLHVKVIVERYNNRR